MEIKIIFEDSEILVLDFLLLFSFYFRSKTSYFS